MTKYIFVTGGVVSGLGKGITASSIGIILKSSNLKVFMQKFDPYLNIDPGTMSPYQHGEVFVTADGAETDLDLGHYERFIDENLTRGSNITSGLIYQNVINKERSGEYEGKTIQVIPHVTNEIKSKVYQASAISKADVIITEIGGTVGDIESLPFIEAIRQVRLEKSKENVLFVHVALVPYLSFSKESKTKPVQHSVKELLSFGVQPDIVVARTEVELEQSLLQKIALFCNIDSSNVFVAENVKSIYEVPLKLNEQNISLSIKKHFNIDLAKPNMKEWEIFVNKIKTSQQEVEVTIVGKYIELPDAYLSVIESLNIAGYENNVIVKIKWIKAEDLNEKNYQSILNPSKAILVPGGFGERGIEGKILAVKYARENNIPYLGICLGMQVACIEIARNLCGLKDANSSEFSDDLKHPVIDIIHGKTKADELGGTLRLGNFQTSLTKNTLAFQLYEKTEIIERHRHRYEFNNKHREMFEQQNVVFSGVYQEKNLVEIIELKNHPFFIASQYHPEFTSRPNKPNPLFNGFIKAIKKS